MAVASVHTAMPALLAKLPPRPKAVDPSAAAKAPATLRSLVFLVFNGNEQDVVTVASGLRQVACLN